MNKKILSFIMLFAMTFCFISGCKDGESEQAVLVAEGKDVIATINGVNYTSVYMHLRKLYVSKGDVVSKDTQIGLMGGNPSTEYWDSCSTGQHLHLTF